MLPFAVVGFCVLFLVGSVLWFKPSKRDQKLARMRQEALISGYKVRQQTVPDLSIDGRINKQEESQYFYCYPITEVRKQTCIVLRTTGESGIYLPDGWTWASTNRASEADLLWLQNHLPKLKDAVTGLELGADYSGVSWNESDESLLPYILETAKSLPSP